MPYASQIVLELFQDQSCLNSSDDVNGDNDSCFYVKTRFNGIDLKLPGCSDLFCQYSEFSDYMDSIRYNGVSADNLDLAC